MDDGSEKLEQLDELITKTMRQSVRFMDNCNFSKQQFVLLRTLYPQKKLTVSELADQLQLSPSATTIAVNRLVKKEYILRNRDETDRRVVWLELSPSGQNLVNVLKQHRAELLIKMLSNLTPQEVDQYIELMRKMTSKFS